jgi:DNA-binding transcriptional MerR regulator
MSDRLPGMDSVPARDAASAIDAIGEGSRSIGEVLNLLNPEFPELTVSKIRFLESQGLIEPARSSSGYRMFTREDVERIQYILREQRDHFLPLKVIKSRLTAWDRGEEPIAPTETLRPPETYFATGGGTVDADGLARASGLSSRQIDELIGQDVLEPVSEGGEPRFDEDALTVAQAASRLLARGLESRHLRTMRLAADREVDLLRQLVAPLLRHRNPDNRRAASEILADGAQAGARLQEGMVRARLRRLLES